MVLIYQVYLHKQGREKHFGGQRSDLWPGDYREGSADFNYLGGRPAGLWETGI